MHSIGGTPLLLSSVRFSYCYDRRLECVATRYYLDPRSQSDSGVTLLFAGGIGLNQETWQPVIQEVFRLSLLPSVWVVERPNHGDPALWNAQAIQTFLTSDILSPAEKSNIVGIGFSGGGAALVQCAELLNKSIPYFRLLYPALRKANLRRPRNWTSVDNAMSWFRSHAPWSSFHPDVLQIISGYITTKTTAEQETAAFIDDGTASQALPYLRTIWHALPVHLILGSLRDFWLPEIQHIVAANIERDRPSLASVTVIEGVGHFVSIRQVHG
ncbi:hypothetical protein DFH09DRAFT_1160568 [Mycena vulgaris]|nr:hypothetical protein DFH09DRAFT_1160568 [Mycena vulgaris]